ncbi:TolC family protein [Roseiarcus sp.]|uniref:TolC family protein n=1 Tax=Roseiarcus sp. TaxID=1969460 RepID=UPI003F97BF1E
MNFRFWLTASIALALGGCDFAPRYTLPTPSLSAKFKDATAEGAQLPANEEWWRTFNDATLNGLQAHVDSANPNLAAAIAANDAEQARAQAALSGLLPQADAIGHVTANKQSNNRPLRSAGQPTYYGDNLIGAQASYEVDIWGRVRNIAASANATAEASAEALDQARLELHAELARDYIDLRGLDDEAKLLSDTIAIYRSALDLTKSRLEAQIASPVDVDRAQTQLSSAEAQASDLALRRKPPTLRCGARRWRTRSRRWSASRPRPLRSRDRRGPCRCPRVPAPFRPTCCGGGRMSPKPNA